MLKILSIWLQNAYELNETQDMFNETQVLPHSSHFGLASQEFF